MADDVAGEETAAAPWVLRTPPGTSEYPMYRDEAFAPSRLACTVAGTTFYYR
ncbi:MAG: hypothetical protein H7270_00910 [Dermatophilaceae bacterium]|nr:hypothetical protein [Dermatophilaceae bacterium]